MRVFSFLFLFALLHPSCRLENNKRKTDNIIGRDLGAFHYIYHFHKGELEKSHIPPLSYKPKLYDLKWTVSSKIFNEDTLIRFVYRSLTEKKSTDSTIEFFRKVRLTEKEKSLIPSNLLGCQLLGVYNSLNEDIKDEIYYSFYLDSQDGLLKVEHLFKLGNVSAAYFYTKRSVDPTIEHKEDIGKLLAVDRALNLTDTLTAKFQ